MNNFWKKLDRLVNEKEIVIERLKGSSHPRYPGYIYPHDYGYLKGTTSSDGGGIDVWVGSGDKKEVTAVISTFDSVKSDMENKILLGCSPTEMREILEFHQRGEMVAELIPRVKV